MLAQEDSVRILHAGEAMCYEYHGFSLTCLQHRFVHIPFCDGVQRAGGFVQNDDVAIPGVDAGDGQKLLLATEKFAPSAENSRVSGVSIPRGS